MDQMKCIVDKLEGQNNWTDWKFQVRIQLQVNNVMSSVQNEFEVPEKPPDKESEEYDKKVQALNRSEYIAQNIIVSSISSQVRQLINMCTSAKDMWDKLHSVFEQRTEQRQDRLFNEFFGTKTKDSNDSVAKHISKLEKLWTELQDETWKEDKVKLPESLFLNRILNTLPDDYFEFLNAWESMPKDQRNLKNLCERLCVVENRLLEKEKCAETTSALAAKTYKFKSNCGYRPKPSEVATTNSRPTNQSGPKCFACGKFGHIKKNCYSIKNNKIDRHAKRNDSQKVDKNKSESLLTVLSVNCDKNNWVVDSGATAHMTPRKEIFVDLKLERSLKVTVANNQIIQSKGVGDVKIATQYGQKVIKDAVFVPDIKTSLLSVTKMTEKGHTVVFDADKCKVYNSDQEIVITATKRDDLYILDEKSECSLVTVENRSQLWHRRLGHLNRIGMDLLRKGMASGLSFDNVSSEPCIACLEGKQTRLPFKGKGGKRVNEPLQLIHSDLCGPMPEKSWGGSRYFLTFIDDHSRKVFVFFLKAKNEVFNIFKQFQAMVENETDKKIKVLRTDNGGEYVSSNMKNHLQKLGIKHQLTIPYTPEQNGLAERTNRTLVEKARCMMKEANCDERFWAEAVNTAAYLANRSPHKAIKEQKTPEEVWSKKKVSLEHLKVFGCVAYTHIPKDQRKKWDSKSVPYIFVGYCEESKGYRLIDPNQPRKIVRAKDVVFLENKFSIDKLVSPREENVPAIIPNPESEVNHYGDNNVNLDEENQAYSNEELSEEVEESEAEDQHDPEIIIQDEAEDDENTSLRRTSRRQRKIPNKFSDFVLFQSTHSYSVPTTYREAMASDERGLWLKAMQKEMEAMSSYNVWDLVDLPQNQKTVKCKWVYSLKGNECGDTVNHKARLVAKGFTQEYGVNYNETFSPVVNKTTLRVLFALAGKLDLSINHLDVNTAFLNGELEETIYMEQPEGFVNEKLSNKVCLLKKALYGLKQSPRVWHNKVEEDLNELGYKKSKYDSCMFTKIKSNSFNVVALHVDDFLVFSNNDVEKSKLKKHLMSKFSVKDLGEAKFFLGLNIEKNDGKVKVSQKTFILDLLKRFNMLDANPVSTPMECNVRLGLSKNEEENQSNSDVPYQSLIGSLMYLAVNTRPDIAYAISYLSQFNTCFNTSHWIAAKRVLRYLKGTINYSLTYECSDLNVKGYVDADWANNVLDRKSYSGFIFDMCNGPVSWEAKKQSCVTLSSTEAEYVAITQAAKECVFLKGLLKELVDYDEPIVVYNDNQSAQRLVYNPVFHNRTKHIDTKFHYIRETVKSNKVVLKYLPTDKMLADVLTKGLPKAKHVFCTKGMNLV